MKPVAIVGMGCRFPGGIRNPADYWEFLLNKGDGMVEVPADRWNLERYYDPDPDAPGRMYTRMGGFLVDPLWDFDPEYFGIAPREAMIMDPQQRLLLEVSAEALDDAGLASRVSGRSVGVYIGGFTTDNMISRHVPTARNLISNHTATSSTFTMLSNRVSFVFDLNGPSMTIDTACSSSLVALHEATQAIVRGECEMALAGGVNAMIAPETFVSMCKGRFLAADGRCKTFDASADGYARGEGAGVVVLKLLDDAVRDGDQIHAVINATGVNQDGRTSGITVPNPRAQADLIRRVLADAGLEPEQVGYIEAHGTGTAVGDPAEMEAVGAALGAVAGRREPLRVGSVKASFGHTEAAAGVAGLIKAALTVNRGRIAPQAWLQQLNPAIPFEEYQLRVPTEVEDFPSSYEVARAAVNGFGYGGTNAHALLAAPPAPVERPVRRAPVAVFPLSGRNDESVRTLAGAWAGTVAEAGSVPSVVDAAWTRRAHHTHRIGLPFVDTADLLTQLRSVAAGEGRGPSRVVADGTAPVVVFSGMGPQWWRMGRDLLQAGGAFARTAREIDEAFTDIAGWSIIEQLLRDEDASEVTRTAVAQPANFLVQVALMADLDALGVRPGVVVGHSVGEVSAAYVSGALDLRDALLVSYHRSRLQATLADAGSMLAVGLPEAEALASVEEAARTDARILPGLIDVAAVNSSTSVTLAGDRAALTGLTAFLDEAGVFARALRVEVPYHSHLMDPILGELAAVLAALRPRAPRLELWSTVTARPVTGADWGPDYWVDNVRQPVRFADAIGGLVEAGHRAFLEVGPHPVLGGNIREVIVRSGETGSVVPTLVRDQNDLACVRQAVADLYSAGCLDTSQGPGGDAGPAPHQQLPRHPWNRIRLWADAPGVVRDRFGDGDAYPLLGDRCQSGDAEWEAPLAVERLPWLRDHVVDGLVLLPGAAYLDAALSAAASLGGRATAALEAVQFIAPLVIDPHDVPVLRTTVEDSTGRFRIRSRRADAEEWTTHVTGRILDGAVTAGSGSEPRMGEGAVPVAGTDLYGMLDAMGLSYGPAFQRIRSVQVEGDVAVADVDAGSAAGSSHLLHPTVTDAALQCMAALIGFGSSESTVPTGAVVPVGVRSVRSLAPLTERVRVSVTRSAGEALGADVVIRDTAGAALVELLGVEFRPVSPAQPLLSALDGLWYEPVWEPRDGRDLADGPRERLLVAHVGPLAAQLSVLADRRPGTLTVELPVQSDRALDPETAAKAVLEPLTVLVDSAAPGETVVVALAVSPSGISPRAGTGPSGIAADLVCALAGLARSAQKFLDDDVKVDIAGVVVTGGAFAVPGDATPPDVTAAALIGARRTVLNEQPRLGWRHVDLDNGTPVEVLEAELAVRAFSHDDADEVALRDGMRMIPRYRHTLADRLAPLEEGWPLDDPEASFVIEKPATHLLSDLALRRSRRRAPDAGEIEVRVECLGLNYKDALKVLGLLRPGDLVGTYFAGDLAMEGLGVVTRVGPGERRYAVGDRLVVGHRGLAQRYLTLAVDQGATHRAPRSWTEPGHFGSDVSFITAHYALAVAARVQPGETVLIHGASGGTGLAAIQVARRLGATVIATASTGERRAAVAAAGAHHVLASRSLTFVDDVRALTGGVGVDVVFNTAPGEVVQQNLHAAAEFGRVVEVGKAAIYGGAVIDLRPFDRNLSLIAVDLDRMIEHRRDLLVRVTEEVSALFDSGQYQPLPSTVYPLHQMAEAFDAVARSTHIGRVVLSLEPGPAPVRPARPRAQIRPAATYLVTGGFGAFGLAVARWLAASGATNLVLAGRSGPSSPAARATVAALEADGVNVVMERCDVADRGDVADLMVRIATTLPPLRGIHHTAGVIADEHFPDLTTDAVGRVLGPKLDGADALRAAVAAHGIELDHLVLFSSISSVAGTQGQMAYAAANTALDSLAWALRADGLPAVSVNWGAMSGGGMAQANEGLERILEVMGLNAIDMDQGCAFLGQALALDTTQVAITDINWTRLAAVIPAAASSPRCSEHVAAGGGGSGVTALRQELAAMTDELRLEVVGFMLAEALAAVLGIPAESIDLHTPLPDLGMDSLMAVEFGARVNMALGVELSALEFGRGGGLAGLASRLGEQMGAPAGPRR